jgi:hypothetical protein
MSCAERVDYIFSVDFLLFKPGFSTHKDEIFSEIFFHFFSHLIHCFSLYVDDD